MEQLGFHWSDFLEILYFSIFRKSVQKLQITIKIWQEWRILYYKDQYIVLITPRSVLLRINYVSDKSVEKIKTLFTFSNFFSPWKSCLLWDHVEKILWSGSGHRWQYGTPTLHAGYQRLQGHTVRKCNTRVGTLIVTTIYLQLIQNRYMFRSFTVLHCSHQHCVQPVASDVEVVGYL